MSSSKKIVSATIWTTVLNIVNAVYGFISVPILINYFGKAEYGLIGLAVSVNVYLQLMDMGFTNTNIRFFSSWLSTNKQDKVNKGFQTGLFFYGAIGIINTIAMLLVALFSESIFNVTAEQDIILKHLFYILALTSFLSWISSCFEQLVKATENVAWYQQRLLFTKILMIIVLFVTIYGSLSIEVYYTLTCLATLSIIPLAYKKIRKDLPYVCIIPQMDKPIFKEILPYSLNVFSFAFFQFTFFQLRPVLLGVRGSIESVADYQVLNGITNVVQLFSGAFIGILLPSTAKIVAENNKDAFYKVAYDGTKYISILKCFCCFGLMSVGADLITVYVGKNYIVLLPWLCLWLACMLGSHNQAISSLIFAGSDVKALSISSALAASLGLIVCWLTIPTYHVGGTVLGFLTYTIVQQIFFYFYYWPRKMNINSLKVFFKSFAPFVLCGLISYLLSQQFVVINNNWFSALYKGSVFTITFILLTLFFINKNDRVFFVHTIRINKK
jgi:O-antigen/teichoic acid export membrane protein